MKIIGLTGKAGSGKDTVAQIALEWCEEKGINAERVAFADPLKLSAARALGASKTVTQEQAVQFCNELKEGGRIKVELPTGPLDPIREYEISGREYLQWYGTEAHRDVFGTEFWVNATMEPLDERFRELRAPDVVFITDCRFPNEAAAVNDRSGEVWEVVRPALEEAQRGVGQPGNQIKLDPKEEQHSSEAGLPEGAIEFQINNSGSLDDLRSLVRSVCESNLEGAK